MLRVATTFIVLLYHAALTYATTPLRLTLWIAYDSSGGVGFDAFIFWVNGFAMPAFFLAAGVSAPAACEARGPWTFVTHRVRRLLRPLLFGSIVILPVTYLIFGFGLLATGRCTLEDIMRWRFSDRIGTDVYGFLHLWFLEYLFVVCMLWCGLWVLHGFVSRKVKTASASSSFAMTAIDRALASSWRPLWFAIPTCLIFLLDSDTMLRVDNRLLPNLFRLAHYTYFFAVGAWIAKIHDPKAKLMPRGTVYLVLSFAVFAAMLPFLLRHNVSPLQGWERVVFCGLAALFPWLTLFGSLGVFLRVIQGRGPVMRFLTEGSFWVYLIHLPLIGAMQVLLLPYHWPALVKFLLVGTVATAVSLWSYEAIVRRSLVGELVNGSRKRSNKTGFFGPEFGWVASLAAIVLVLSGLAWSYRVFFWGNNFHEEIAGRLYRSARLSPRDLDVAIREKSIQTVLTFSANASQHDWYIGQKQICDAHKVGLISINLKADRLPSKQILAQLMNILENSPRPLLAQGYRGIYQSGFAAAVAELLDGVPPSQALHEFDSKYGQFAAPDQYPLGQFLLSYRDWLQAHKQPHTPDRFQAWILQDYQPGESADRDDAVARARREPAVVR
jgi:peptidoglycan/LPS O-acetylase OafA/YrhL